MGRKKRPNSQHNAHHQGNQNDPKKARSNNETGESYLVKKYRPTKIYAAMEAFVNVATKNKRLFRSINSTACSFVRKVSWMERRIGETRAAS